MKKTTRKEVYEEFDEHGNLLSRTTTEETVEEDNNLAVSPYPSWVYCNGSPSVTTTATASINDTTYTNDPDQITMEQFFRGE